MAQPSFLPVPLVGVAAGLGGVEVGGAVGLIVDVGTAVVGGGCVTVGCGVEVCVGVNAGGVVEVEVGCAVSVGVEVGGIEGVSVGVVVDVGLIVGVGASGKVAEPRSVTPERLPASSRTTSAK